MSPDEPPPLLGILVDRSSFDETDDFGIDQERLESETPWLGEDGPRPVIVMKNGMIRRKLRWRPRRARKTPESTASVTSTASRSSRKSVHSFASTETVQKSNTRRAKQQQQQGKAPVRRFPLPRPNYPDHFGRSTIGSEGLQKEQQPPHPSSSPKQSSHPSFDPYQSPMRHHDTKGLPPLFQPSTAKRKLNRVTYIYNGTSGGPVTTTTIATTADEQELPVLASPETDRTVDLRIKQHYPPVTVTPSPPRHPSSSSPTDEFRDYDSAGSNGVDRYNLVDAESDDDTDDDDTVTNRQRVGVPARAASEWRFPMRQNHDIAIEFDNDDGSAIAMETPKSSIRTGPVDVDEGTFLEVEKNLKAIHEVAAEHLKQGEYAEALEVFEEILRGQLARYGERHHRVGTAHHNIGIVHARRGNYPKAIASYKEAVRVRKMCLEEHHPDVAVSLAQLGVTYLELCEYKKALRVFRESLKIRRHCYGNRHPKVAKILNNMGCALYEMDELGVAQVAFEEALSLQRSLLRTLQSESSEVPKGQLLGIASTQSNLASIKLIHGQLEEAMVDLEEALLIQECVLPDDHPIVRRTRESLLWLEESRFQRSSSINAQSRPGCLSHLPNDHDALAELRGPIDSFPSLLDVLESRFVALRTRLDFTCGDSNPMIGKSR